MEDCASYFDTISIGALSNIVRYLSVRPNAIDWPRFVSPNQVLNIASTSDSLIQAIARALNCLRSGNFFDKCPGCDLSLVSYRKCRCLGTGERTMFSAEDPQYFSFMIRHYEGPFVQLISYLGAYVPQLDFPSGQVLTELKAAAIIRYCSAMDELNLYEPVETNLMRSIIQHRGGQLKKLKCNSNLGGAVPTIGKYCVNLRELCLTSEDNLSSILATVGDRLTALGVRKYVGAASYETIQYHCPNLRSIRVFCRPELYDVLIDLYMFYGPQLRHACFLSFNSMQCRRALEVCTNVEVTSIDLGLEGGGDGEAVINTLQNRIVHEVNVDYLIVLKAEDHLSDALSRCYSIVALRVFGRSYKEDDGIDMQTFRLPMPNLEEFNTGYLRPKEIKWLAKSTHMLKTLVVSVDFGEKSYEEIWEAFRSVAQSNPELKQVKIYLLNFWHIGVSKKYPLRVPGYDGERFLYHLIGAFQKSYNLRELIIVCYPSVKAYWDYLYCVEDACYDFYLGRRRLSLSVLGVDYLPLEVYPEDVKEEGGENNAM